MNMYNNYPYYPKPNNGINWIQGMEAAKAYPMMPNSNVVLMDSESDRFFIKTSDNVGMCSIRTFKYTEEKDVSSDYVTRSELEEILRGIRNDTISADEQPEDE